jgi:SAM-dependent methyltransferase
MNDEEYDRMRQVEDSYWWYAVLRESVAGEVRDHLAGKPAASVLDAGCGTGGMMRVLQDAGPAWEISGVDMSLQALEHTRSRGFTKVTRASVDALPYADASFDVVVSLDVLYFEGVDDTKAMSEFHRVLKPGGMLILNLPAFEVLRGEHDRAVSGVRRYTPIQVHRLLEMSKMEVVRVHCWNAWLFIPILGWRLLSRTPRPNGRTRAKSDLCMLPPILNKALTALARVDMALCRIVRSPLGTSVHAVAIKRVS